MWINQYNSESVLLMVRGQKDRDRPTTSPWRRRWPSWTTRSTGYEEIRLPTAPGCKARSVWEAGRHPWDRKDLTSSCLCTIAGNSYPASLSADQVARMWEITLGKLPVEDSAGHVGSTVPAGYSTFAVPAGLESPPFLGASFSTYGKFGKLYFSQEHHYVFADDIGRTIERLCSLASFVESVFKLKLCSSAVFFRSPREVFQATFFEHVMCTQHKSFFCSLCIGPSAVSFLKKSMNLISEVI